MSDFGYLFSLDSSTSSTHFNFNKVIWYHSSINYIVFESNYANPRRDKKDKLRFKYVSDKYRMCYVDFFRELASEVKLSYVVSRYNCLVHHHDCTLWALLIYVFGSSTHSRDFSSAAINSYDIMHPSINIHVRFRRSRPETGWQRKTLLYVPEKYRVRYNFVPLLI
jgi:hypothetical protein